MNKYLFTKKLSNLNQFLIKYKKNSDGSRFVHPKRFQGRFLSSDSSSLLSTSTMRAKENLKGERVDHFTEYLCDIVIGLTSDLRFCDEMQGGLLF